MISLERLLDGLEVQIDAPVVHDVRGDGARAGTRLHAPTVHYRLSGSGSVELVGGATLRFARHRVMVLPAGWRTGIGPVDDAHAADPDVVTACGQIRAAFLGSMGLFDHLREPLVENLADDDPIRRSFQELVDEIAAQRPGFRTMAEALLRRCLVLLLRRHCEHGDNRLSWLAALEDARLGRAVAAMQERPEHAFTLPRLAEVAGMSRSVFAARFAGALGESPIEFLKRLRLARAARLLTGTDMPVKTVAAEVGYSSRSSFTRAFLARHGARPTAFRAAAREATPPARPRARAA